MAQRAGDGQGPLQVVWFKRDLRVQDHRPLARAAEAGPVLPVFIVEPALWREPDMSARQWGFAAECLEELRAALAGLGQPLVIRIGEASEVLEAVRAQHGIAALWSHEETGNGWTFARDRRVAAWARAAGIAWHELRQSGVHRRLGSRDGWARRWESTMAEPITPAPALAPLSGVAWGGLPTAVDLGLAADPCPERQPGGRAAGIERLTSFLERRGETYRSAMSSPLGGAEACSRLSPHLAWGTLSMRETAQATRARQRTLRAEGGRSKWRGALTSFAGRLHWHCHFMQKLEDAPKIERRCLHPAYEGMRPAEPDAARLHAWASGETGLPFLDACMRCLAATGWLNFRMRAMVMATASYHLWLHWRAPGLVLARRFTDYEAGIHWPQVQMQSGTTGINTVRIYNPVKQGFDQDPDGVFIRRWVPELADLPTPALHTPWLADAAAPRLGRSYPAPIVDHLEAARHARERVWAVRKGESYRGAASAIQARHGSRRSGMPLTGRKPRPAKAKATAQLSLPLDLEPNR